MQLVFLQHSIMAPLQITTTLLGIGLAAVILLLVRRDHLYLLHGLFWPRPIVVFGREYWERVLNFQAFIDTGMIDEDDLKLWKWADSVDEAFEHLTTSLSGVHLDPPKYGYDDETSAPPG